MKLYVFVRKSISKIRNRTLLHIVVSRAYYLITMATCPEYKLFVGNLPSDISDEDMRTVFSTYGHVTDVHIMTGRSKSGAACAFVHYDDVVSAEQAIQTLNRAYKIRLDAQDPITVSWAKQDGERRTQNKEERNLISSMIICMRIL